MKPEERLQVKIRRMDVSDAAAAAQIEAICFTENWSERVYHATLLLPYAHYYAAELDGKMIGTIGLQVIGGDGEISNVAVLPQYRRRGIGHLLMETVLADGEALVSGDYTLEVREGNTAARALYESCGFAVEGVRKEYYTRPAENALIMWKRMKRN